MTGYINANAKINMDADDFLALFKSLYCFIKEKLHKKEHDEEMSFDELVELYSHDEEFLNELEYIKTSLNDIDELMEEIQFTYDEYYNFLSIKDMISYIADDVSLFLKYSQFILTLMSSFANLLDRFNDSDYENIYKKFDVFLYDAEDIFYTEIFEYCNEYDDLIDKITKRYYDLNEVLNGNNIHRDYWYCPYGQNFSKTLILLRYP